MRWLALVVGLRACAWSALLALCACDRLLGLHANAPADASDAAFFDGPISYTCPPIGTTPSYYTDLRQVVAQQCDRYAASSSGLALARCVDASGDYVVMTGMIDQMLAAPTGIADPTTFLVGATIGADDTAVITVITNGTPQMYEYRTYVQLPDQTWARGTDLIPAMPSSVGGFLLVATPTTTTPRHLAYANNNGNSLSLHELVEGAGGWAEAPWSPISFAALGLTDVSTLRLSPDGRRIVLSAQTAAGAGVPLYADRQTIDVPFRALDALDAVPYGSTPFMSDDCARIYVSGLDRIFYLQEQ